MRFVLVAVSALALLLQGPADAATAKYREFVEGSPKATVTVIEYASLTCPHCAHFYNEGFARLKATYIDTGKIQFIFRDLPTPPYELAVSAALLARCAPEGRGMELIGALFKNQDEWMHAPDERLHHYAAQVGIGKEGFDTCLNDEALLKKLETVVDEGVKKYNLEGTPTFVVNDKVLATTEYEELAPLIDKALEKK